MAFDDTTGGLDRARHHSPEPVWGDDWGDRHPRRMFDACRVSQERQEVDQIAREKYLARRARIAADATRSRAAPVEAALRREQASKERGTFGAVLAKAFAKDKARAKKR